MNKAGTVGVMLASNTERYYAFTEQLESLELPEGSRKKFDYGSNGAQSRNDVIRYALEVAGSEWVWFIDDEHSFSPEIVNVLLSRDVPVACPIVIDRVQPFSPLAYVDVSRTGDRIPLLLDDVVGPGTMIEIEAARTIGMLIQRPVFEALGKTFWFEEDDPESELSFCDRARESGFPIYVDTSVRLGNHCTASMFPVHRGGKWEIGVTLENEIEVSMPITR